MVNELINPHQPPTACRLGEQLSRAFPRPIVRGKELRISNSSNVRQACGLRKQHTETQVTQHSDVPRGLCEFVAGKGFHSPADERKDPESARGSSDTILPRESESGAVSPLSTAFAAASHFVGRWRGNGG